MKTLAALALAMTLSATAHAASVTTTWAVTPDAGETISDPVLSGGVLSFKITTEGGTGGSITFKTTPPIGEGVVPPPVVIVGNTTILPPDGKMTVAADVWSFGKVTGGGSYALLRNTVDTKGKGELLKSVKTDVYTRAGVNWYKWFAAESAWGWIGTTEPSQ